MPDALRDLLAPTAKVGTATAGATFARNGSLRLTLTRRWALGTHVLFIGHNPSTADHQLDDPTVRRWTHFARAWGHSGFVAVNLYPIRTPDPAECRRWADWEDAGPDWYARDDLQHNVSVVEKEAAEAALVVACWGAIARDTDWIDHVLDAVGKPVHCLGLTMSGAPIHPMARGRNRVPDDAMPIPYPREWMDA